MSRSVDRLNQKIFFLPTFISLIRSKIRRQVVVDCWMDSVVLVFVFLQWKKNPTLFCWLGSYFIGTGGTVALQKWILLSKTHSFSRKNNAESTINPLAEYVGTKYGKCRRCFGIFLPIWSYWVFSAHFCVKSHSYLLLSLCFGPQFCRRVVVDCWKNPVVSDFVFIQFKKSDTFLLFRGLKWSVFERFLYLFHLIHRQLAICAPFGYVLTQKTCSLSQLHHFTEKNYPESTINQLARCGPKMASIWAVFILFTPHSSSTGDFGSSAMVLHLFKYLVQNYPTIPYGTIL